MKKTMKKTCACFMAAVSIMTAAASPLYAQEANENALQMTEEQAKAAAAEVNRTGVVAMEPQSWTRTKVSKYDLVPGQYYVIESSSMTMSGVGWCESSTNSYELIQVVDVFEDYTWFFELWSHRKAHVKRCISGNIDRICCDDYTFYLYQ